MRTSFSILVLFSLLIHSCSSGAEKNRDQQKTSPDFQTEETKRKTTSPKYNTPEATPISLTKEDFLEKVMNYEKNQEKWEFEGELPCLVDFYADWCAPCKMVAPILDELAKEYKGKIHIYKINIEQEKELAAAFGIRSIPTFLYCPINENPQILPSVAASREQTKQMLVNHIEQVLLSK